MRFITMISIREEWESTRNLDIETSSLRKTLKEYNTVFQAENGYDRDVCEEFEAGEC